jgi:hypothetical protein
MVGDPNTVVNFSKAPLSQIITAIGGLGTAAFGLVDASKSAFRFINRIGLIQKGDPPALPGWQ